MNPDLAAALSLFFGAFVSEDASVLAAGLLLAGEGASPLAAFLGPLLGIFVSDLGMVALGRLAASGSHHRWVRRFSPSPAELERASRWFSRHGGWVIPVSRFVPGTRSLTGFAAGFLRVPLTRFVPIFLAASALWTFLAVSLVAWAGKGVAEQWSQHSHWATALVIAVGVLAWVALFSLKHLLNPESRLLLKARWQRLTRFEFWPIWAVYFPVILHMAFRLWPRHRRALCWTAVNPALPLGGLSGESKSHILNLLQDAGGPVATFAVVPPGSPEQRLRMVEDFAGGQWPLVLKPDVGERGSGVAVIRDVASALGHLKTNTDPLIAQQFVSGEEFGVFYARHPGETSGRILSVTGKSFPVVVGDSSSTVRSLILRHPRGALLWKHFSLLHAARLDSVLPQGEQLALTELGNHCRGSVFLDRNRLASPALLAALDAFMTRTDGLYFGRFDLRADSEQALSEGRFTLFEFNGVSSEPGHIYDPEHGTAAKGWAALIAQWSLAWEIGSENIRRGAKPASWSEFWREVFRPSSPHGKTTPSLPTAASSLTPTTS